MIRRLGLSTLWFLSAWTTAAMVTFALGLPSWIVPLAAVVAAASTLRMSPGSWRLINGPEPQGAAPSH